MYGFCLICPPTYKWLSMSFPPASRLLVDSHCNEAWWIHPQIISYWPRKAENLPDFPWKDCIITWSNQLQCFITRKCYFDTQYHVLLTAPGSSPKTYSLFTQYLSVFTQILTFAVYKYMVTGSRIPVTSVCVILIQIGQLSANAMLPLLLTTEFLKQM
jgi:hypothetical protein